MSNLLVERDFFLLNATFAMAILDLLHSFISPKRKRESQYSFPPLGRFTPWEDPRDPITRLNASLDVLEKSRVPTRLRQEGNTCTHSRSMFKGPCIANMFQSITNKMQRYTVYFCKLLYMFRVDPPPIIRSTHSCIYSIWYLSNCY